MKYLIKEGMQQYGPIAEQLRAQTAPLLPINECLL